MIVLGLKCFSHDTGAAIVTDRAGTLEITAISEARLNRRKHSFSYPLMSIAYCLEALGLERLDEVDAICIDRHMETWPEAGSQFGYENARNRINHVDAHAASAYFVSPFDDVAVLIAEGGTGIYHGAGPALEIVDRIGYFGDTYRDRQRLAERQDHFVNSSFFYDKISGVLGYDAFGASQTMALAGFAHLLPRQDHVKVDPGRFDDFVINHDETVFGMTGLEPYAGEDSDALVDARWVNFARQAQETLEEDILHLAALARRKTRSNNLCLAGGAALNCIINGKIIESGLFTGVYVQPAASDEGIPLGCALAGYYRRGGTARSEMTTAYLGRANAPAEAAPAARRWGVTIRPTDTHELAALLANGKIIGRVAGRSEYGPRALGNRAGR